MASSLEDKLSLILQEKQSKIIPENIKKDIQIFDITGTYEGNSGGVKLFETEEQMQQDTNANEGDLAVIYREEIQNMTVDTQAQYITFPETVILPEAFVGDAYVDIRAVDGSGMASGNVMLQSDAFRFDWFGRNGMVRISYTSSDGITFTRDNFQGDEGELTNPVDLGSIVKCSMPENWNEAFGYFMQTRGSAFEGLYKYETTTEQFDNDYIVLSNNFETKLVKLIDIQSKEGPSISNTYEVYVFINSFETSSETKHGYQVHIPKDYTLIYNFQAPNGSQYRAVDGLIYTQDDKMYIWGNNFHTDNSEYYNDISCIIETYENKTLVSTNTYTYKQLLDMSILLRNTGSYWLDYYYSEFNLPEEYSIENLYGYKTKIKTIQYDAIIKKYEGEFINLPLDVSSTYLDASVCSNELLYMAYIQVTSQLTTTKDLVYNSIYYGKDGVNEGTLTQNVSNSFADINAEVYSKMQQVYNNMEPRVLTDDNKTIDKNIYVIPTKLDGTLLMDTSNITSMYEMFADCTNLKILPQLNTSKVTSMYRAFTSCSNLITVSQFDTSSVTNMMQAFQGCKKLTTIPKLDTSKVTNMEFMFSECNSMINIPVLDTSSVTNIYSMFWNCPNLSDDSLNNILQMCINAAVYTGTKTLRQMLLSKEQATKCTTLSNYSAFTAAGWTTGY